VRRGLEVGRELGFLVSDCPFHLLLSEIFRLREVRSREVRSLEVRSKDVRKL
jgi:hypothetical protein